MHLGTDRLARAAFRRNDIVEAELLSSLVHKLGHEIGNPLTSIISLGSIIDKFSRLPDSPLDQEKTANYAKSIVKEAWRVSALTEKLVLLLSARDGSQQGNDLLSLIHSAIAKLQTRQNFDSDWIQLIIEDENVSAHCDGDQAIILLCECISNAYQAVGAIDAKEAPETPEVKLRLRSEKGEAIVEVFNEQRHASPFELAELFEPFTTTWEDQKHLGLGLCVAAGIVERSGGQIEIEERALEKGVEFITRIRFLNSEAAKERHNEVREQAPILERSLFPEQACILIVDDEPTVASAISKILELSLQGLDSISIQCLSGEEALARIAQSEEISLIICDLNLEGMSGRHILETIQNSRPELAKRFAFVTGDAKRSDTELYLSSCGRPYLSKPFEPEALLQLVRELCEDRTE